MTSSDDPDPDDEAAFRKGFSPYVAGITRRHLGSCLL